MKKFLALLVLPAVALCFGFAPAKCCHSEEYRYAIAKLDRMILNKSQEASIATYKTRFRQQWNHDHSSKGCRHFDHEDYAQEFIAAAAGVLNDRDFVKFQRRARTETEKIGHSIWKDQQFAKNALTIAKSL